MENSLPEDLRQFFDLFFNACFEKYSFHEILMFFLRKNKIKQRFCDVRDVKSAKVV